MAFFLKCHSYCHTTITNCSYAKYQEEQLIAHKSIVRGSTPKCYKHTGKLNKSIETLLFVQEEQAILFVFYGFYKYFVNFVFVYRFMILFDVFICCLPCEMLLIVFVTPGIIKCADERKVLLPDTKRQTTMFCRGPNNFFLWTEKIPN